MPQLKLVAFDLDGTLAESKAALDTEMGLLLIKLLNVSHVAVISGGDWPQFEKQVLSHIPPEGRRVNLSILPTCGTKFYQFDTQWKKLYSEDFSAAEKSKIIDCLRQAVKQSGFEAKKLWGEQIEDRSSQITYSALGQQAPLEEKKSWDPDYVKRKQIKALLEKTLPEFSVQMGGATSIDITRPGINKAYGMYKLRDVLGIPISQMLFVGDALFEGGNDNPARSTGVTCIQVAQPHETKRVIEALVACLS